MSKNEHCVLQTHLKQRRALKARFCEWRGVNSNNCNLKESGIDEIAEKWENSI